MLDKEIVFSEKFSLDYEKEIIKNEDIKEIFREKLNMESDKVSDFLLKKPTEIREEIKGIMRNVISGNSELSEIAYKCSPELSDFEKLFDKPAFMKKYEEEHKKQYEVGIGNKLYKRLDGLKIKDVSIKNQIRKEMRIYSCPYCNRNYVGFIDWESSKMNSQLDHIYPKSLFPEFAISLYNFILSCASCNHAKGEKILLYHPYIKHTKGDKRFIFNNVNNSMDVEDVDEVLFDLDERFSGLKLNGLYGIHNEYLKELNLIYKSYLTKERSSEYSFNVEDIRNMLIGKSVVDSSCVIDRTLSVLTTEYLDYLDKINNGVDENE